MNLGYNDQERKYLILYPLSKVKIESTIQLKNGISVINSNDNSFWESYSSEFLDASYFNLLTGEMMYRPICLPLISKGIQTWIAYEYDGSLKKLKKFSVVEMRTVVSAILCLLEKHKPINTIKSCKLEEEYLLYFPNKSLPSDFGLSYTSCQPIFPSLIEEIYIKSSVFSEIDDWYDSMLAADQPLRNRMRVACFTLPGALIATGDDRLLKFFIINDALFGVDNIVGKSFKNGIKVALRELDPFANDKAEMLYNLRCAFMHGDIIFYDEWQNYDSYIRNFNSDPIDDMLKVTLNSIQKYFQIGPLHFKQYTLTAAKKREIKGKTAK